MLKDKKFLNDNKIAEAMEKEPLDKGGQGTVFRIDQSNYVVKVAAIDTVLKKQSIRNEVDFLWHLKGIPGVVEIDSCAYNNYYFLIKVPLLTAHMRTKKAYTKLASMTFLERLELYRSLTETLAKIHEKGIIHGDIKPENLMIDESLSRIYVIDFGLALRKPSFQLSGTLVYLTPELLLKARAKNFIDDLWALGLSIAEIEFGFDLILNQEYDFCISLNQPFNSMPVFQGPTVDPKSLDYNLAINRIEECKTDLFIKLQERIKKRIRKILEICNENGAKKFLEFFDKTLSIDPNTRAQTASEILDSLNMALDLCQNRQVADSNPISQIQFPNGALSQQYFSIQDLDEKEEEDDVDESLEGTEGRMLLHTPPTHKTLKNAGEIIQSNNSHPPSMYYSFINIQDMENTDQMQPLMDSPQNGLDRPEQYEDYIIDEPNENSSMSSIEIGKYQAQIHGSKLIQSKGKLIGSFAPDIDKMKKEIFEIESGDHRMI